MANDNEENDEAKRREKEPQESDGMGNNMAAAAERKKVHVCQRRFIRSTALEEEEEEEEDDDDDEMNHYYYVCEKQFPSKNSLYGHMKNRHPVEIQEEEEAQEVVDLQSRLKPRWGATRRRTKIKHGGDDDVAPPPPLRHLLDVADKEDRRIRRGGGGDFGSTQKKKKKKKKINNNAPSSRMENKGKADHHHDVPENPRFGDRVKRSGSCSSSEDDDTDEYYCNNHMEEIRINGGILNPKQIHRKIKKSLIMEPERESKKRKRAVKVESAEEEEEEEEKKCKCNRGFSSSQPLGRHKEIMLQQHNNNNNNKVKTEILKTAINDNDENQSNGVERRVNKSRRAVQQVASQETMIPTAAAARIIIPKVVLRFDLNEMPDAAAAAANVDDEQFIN